LLSVRAINSLSRRCRDQANAPPIAGTSRHVPFLDDRSANLVAGQQLAGCVPGWIT
jgi:hypothetical protein